MKSLVRASYAVLRGRFALLASLALASFASTPLHAQTYNVVVPLTQVTLDGNTTTINPGDVVGIDAGDRSRLILKNIHGTSTNPVIIVNKGGKVRVGNFSSGEAVTIDNCSYFQFRGDGAAGIKYGFDVYKAGGQCVEIAGLSTNYEVCFIEVSNPGFAGIMAKTDPGSGGYATRGTFTQYNTVIHDCYAHDIPGEGFYVGNSFYAAGTSNGLPSDLVGTRIYNNLTVHCGREGIQVGSSSSDCEIYNNVLKDSGYLDIANQRNGLQIGEGTTGKCYNNTIIGSRAHGIVMLGLGDNLVFNNVIVGPLANGLFCDNRPPAQISGGYIKIYNNTIINPGQAAFLCYNEISTVEYKNNISIVPNTAYPEYATGSGATIVASNNIFQRNTTGLAFVDTSSTVNDYRIGASSVAADAGLNLSPAVTTDLEGLARPFGAAFDAGAYEAGALSVALRSTNPTTSGATDGTISVSAIGGTAPYTYAWSDGPTGVSRTGLGAGTYTVTVTDAASTQRVRSVTLTEPPALLISAKILPELANANDGSVALTITGGKPPYTISWAHGPTTATITGLDAGYYTYTVHDSGVGVLTKTVFVRDGGTPIYRVECGGDAVTDRVINWAKDKGTGADKSPYLVSTGTLTTGSNSWSGTQSTEGPNNLFGSRRYLSSTTVNTMQWAFPVSSGYYEVQLYFNENDSAIAAEGDRVFNVALEGSAWLTNLDLFARHGANHPAQYNRLVQVTDGTINLDLTRVVGNPIITAIAIHQFSALPEGTPLYRVNNGGIDETGTAGVNWLRDKQTTPSAYLKTAGQLTTGSNSWSSGGTNPTDAPDNVFGSWRYDPTGSQEMKWEFPVEAGFYRVNLYFIERDAAITGANQRYFDVSVEGSLFLADYDVYEIYGFLHPARESTLVEVQDGVINLDFAHRTGGGNPMISGISIHRVR
jgi:hypothetical protein